MTITRVYLLDKSRAMMSESGELLVNPAYMRGAEAYAYDRAWANDLTRKVVHWLRVFDYGYRRGHFREQR